MSVRYHLPLLVGGAGAQTIAPSGIASSAAVGTPTVTAPTLAIGAIEGAGQVSGRETFTVGGRSTHHISGGGTFRVSRRRLR